MEEVSSWWQELQQDGEVSVKSAAEGPQPPTSWSVKTKDVREKVWEELVKVLYVWEGECE